MKFLIALLTTLVCVNAYRVRVDSISSASSEELIIRPPVVGQPQPSILPKPIVDSISSASSEELIVLPHGGPRQIQLTGVGVLGKPILQAVKVKSPLYGALLGNNHMLAQIFAPQDAAV
ncbi:uncharacterized protein LOC105664682 [Ceratitis capitata]|uniref:uncharacterized protein LOC105664682 n=1 Tax=Ceratitis capitata TaxID=7213 RepID=UPI0006188B3D|nr:uncharacterized protein LOC105664682 [Ceratitis capitata]